MYCPIRRGRHAIRGYSDVRRGRDAIRGYSDVRETCLAMLKYLWYTVNDSVFIQVPNKGAKFYLIEPVLLPCSHTVHAVLAGQLWPEAGRGVIVED